MISKKLLLTIGRSTAVVGAPIVVLASCGTNNSESLSFSEEDKKAVDPKLDSLVSMLKNPIGFASNPTLALKTEGQINYFLSKLPSDLDINEFVLGNLFTFYAMSQAIANPSSESFDKDATSTDAIASKLEKFTSKLKNILISKYPQKSKDIESFFEATGQMLSIMKQFAPQIPTQTQPSN